MATVLYTRVFRAGHQTRDLSRWPVRGQNLFSPRTVVYSKLSVYFSIRKPSLALEFTVTSRGTQLYEGDGVDCRKTVVFQEINNAVIVKKRIVSHAYGKPIRNKCACKLLGKLNVLL